MIYKEMTIEIPGGLKSRTAASFVQVAGRYNSQLLIECGNKKVNAKSIMGVLSLGLKTGDKLFIIASGDDANSAVESLGKLLKGEMNR